MSASDKAAATARSGYRPDIDGLRALAVAGVILFHFDLGPFVGGFVGVDIFFVLSGFLIVSLLKDARGFSLAGFLERRARRILPALLVVLAACCCAAATLLPNDLKAIGLGLITGATFTSNIYFLRLADDYFAAGVLAAHPALHTWSLGVEAQFYVAVALLWTLARRWPGLRGPGLALLGALSFAASLWAVTARPEAAFYLMPFRFWEFMVGAAMTLPATAIERRPGLRATAVAAGLAIIVIVVLTMSSATPFPGAAALPPCLGAALVIRGGAGPNAASRWLGAAPLALMGRLSYSLYLWHWPLFVLASYGQPGPLPIALRVGLLVPTALIAAATYRLVERPLIERRRLGSPMTFVAAGVAGIVVIGLAGLVINLAGQHRLVLRAFPPAVTRLSDGQFDTLEQNCPVEAAEAAPACRFGTAGVAPTVVLWGNSFARMWLPALDRSAARHGMAGVALLLTRCPPLPDQAVASVRGCGVFNRDALAFMMAHPALKTVVLGGNWSSWTADLPALWSTVASLAASGRRVVAILSPPFVPYPVPRTLALAVLKDHPPPPLVTEAEAQRVRGAEREAMAEIAATLPLTLVDPFSGFCDGTACAVAADGVPLYSDGEHVTRFGAARTEALFDPVFAAPDRETR